MIFMLHEGGPFVLPLHFKHVVQWLAGITGTDLNHEMISARLR